MTDPSQGLEAEAAVCDFVELWLEDRECSRVRSLAEYLVRFPSHEARIAREYLVLTDPVATREQSLARQSDERIGPYQTLGLLGQGGQGTVWLAQDTRLGRQVALKVLDTGGSGFSATRISRLRREAQALARLDHPGICAIYEADLDGSRPYLAMRFVEGDTLATLLADAREGKSTLLPPRTKESVGSWLLFFAQAAEALHAAHELGIVHRDVKPGNLIRTREGLPVLLDFGLARDVESTTVSLTQSGELFGTLPYMAPELLLGRAPDRRIDVYALGVTLYETFALRRPFEAATHEALRRQIESGEVRPISEVVPGLSPEFSIVLATAIEREPDRRYVSAQAFADDLRRVERGDPIAARAIGIGVRARRLVERHPVLAASVVILTLALAVSLWLLTQVSRGREQLYALREAYRALSLSEDNPGRALEIATEAALREPHPEINDILLRILDRYWEQHQFYYRPPSSADRGDFSPWVETDRASRFVLFAAGNGSVNTFDLETGTIRATLQHSKHGMVTAALAPSGEQVLTGGFDGSVSLWDLATTKILWTRPAHTPAASSLEGVPRIVFAPDGRHAVSCGDDGIVLVHDVLGAAPPVRCAGHTGAVARATFDPTGALVLTVGDVIPSTTRGDLTVRIFDAVTGQQLQRLGPFSGPVRWEAWSSDGKTIVLANDDGKARIFSAADGSEVAAFAHQGQVNWVAFANDDRQLLTGSPEGFSVFDIATGARVVRHADFHDRSVYRGAVSPDGSRVAVVAWDDTGRIYDTKSWKCVRTLRGITTRPRGLCWDHSGNKVITVGGTLQTWYATERPFLPSFEGHTDRVLSARFSADGAHVLTACADKTARFWEVSSGRCLQVLEHQEPLRGAVLSPDASRIATCPEGAPPRVFLRTADPVLQNPVSLGKVAAREVWFYGNDEVVAAGADGVVRLFAVPSGRLEHEFVGHTGDIQCGVFHPTRPWLVTGGNDSRVGIWDLARRVSVLVTEPWPPGPVGVRERVFDLAFDAGGGRLAASCEDFALRVWSVDDLSRTTTIKVSPTFGKIAFLEDRNCLLYAAQWSGIVRILDFEHPERTESAPTQHSNMISRLVLRSDSKLALTASRDGTVSLFDPSSGKLFSLIHASDVAVVDACFSPDGTQVLTAAADGSVRIWPVDPLAIAQRYRQHSLAREPARR